MHALKKKLVDIIQILSLVFMCERKFYFVSVFWEHIEKKILSKYFESISVNKKPCSKMYCWEDLWSAFL